MIICVLHAFIVANQNEVTDVQLFTCKKKIFKLKVIRTWFQLKKRVTNDVTRLCEHVCWSKKKEEERKILGYQPTAFMNVEP